MEMAAFLFVCLSVANLKFEKVVYKKSNVKYNILINIRIFRSGWSEMKDFEKEISSITDIEYLLSIKKR